MPKTGGTSDGWLSLWLMLAAGIGLVAAGWFLRRKSSHA
jgi:LPXTG-motif cell wall-anchored protein